MTWVEKSPHRQFDVGPALLFCPAMRPDRVVKAQRVADGVIVDLEDSVSPAQKREAREHALEVATDLEPQKAMVRVNTATSQWFYRDVEIVSRSGLDTVMLPKVSSPEEVEAISPLRVVALCETVSGILAASAIAASDNCVGLMWGAEDLIADIGGRTSRRQGDSHRTGYRGIVEHARATTLIAASANGIPAIDAIHPDIGDEAGLLDEARDAAGSGFLAKACIHPKQVEPIRNAYRPTESEFSWARGVLIAAQDSSDGVFVYKGQMIDQPLVRQAKAILRHA